MQALYTKLSDSFLQNGYHLTFNDRSGDGDSARWGMSAEHGDFTFSLMLDGYYLEASLDLASDDLLVQYDILDGSYSCDIFVPSTENQERAKQWHQLLEDEVRRLNLSIYIDNNSLEEAE